MHPTVPDSSEAFVPPGSAAIAIGVPERWLRHEAAAGRLPSLKAGRRLFFNVDQVRRVLIERAEADGCGGAQ